MTEDEGTYAAVTFDATTNEAIRNYTTDANLPNAVPPNRLHTTLLYSRLHMPHYEPIGPLMMALWGVPVGLEVWPDQHDKRYLVLRYDCPELNERHAYLMEEHGATYDPIFMPHITLSYDIGDLDITTLPDIHKYLNVILIVHEYSETLILDWPSTILID
jgi:2'-5' RNA ligase